MVLGGEIHGRVPVAGLNLAGKPKVPKITEHRLPLGLPGGTGDPVSGPGSVTLNNQPSQRRRVSQSNPNTMVPNSLEEKEVLEKRKHEENNTNAWKKREEKEEGGKSKFVQPQPPRMVKKKAC